MIDEIDYVAARTRKLLRPHPGSKVSTGCHEWQRKLNRNGYAEFDPRRAKRAGGYLVHRFIWSYWNGPVPPGYHVHHRCENRKCVRRSHLKAVTPFENIMASDTITRVNVLKTRCPRGHRYDVFKYGERRCRRCSNAHAAAYRARLRTL